MSNMKDLKGLADQSTSAGVLKPEPVGLNSLANETLTQVAEYLIEDITSFNGLMFTNRRLTGVCEYLRYTSLSVQGSRGRRLLATLISGSLTATRYCNRVKRVWFKYWQDAEMYLVTALMCEALPLMVNLISLRIDAHSIDVEHTLGRMNKAGLIRTGSHPAYALEKAALPGVNFSALNLPNVQNLMLSGSFDLASIANHRTLTELTLESYLDYDDVAELLAKADNTLLGKTLTILSIKFVRSIDLRLTLPMVSQTFPNLKKCALEQSALDFMGALDTIGAMTPLFAKLHLLVLNRRLNYPLMRWGSRLEAELAPTEAVTDKLNNPSFHHANLNCIGMGRHLWTRCYSGTFRETKGLHKGKLWDNHFGNQFLPFKFPSW